MKITKMFWIKNLIYEQQLNTKSKKSIGLSSETISTEVTEISGIENLA